MSTQITPTDRDVFRAITEASNIVLLDTTFDGQPAAAICALSQVDGEYLMEPLAVLVNDEPRKRLAFDGIPPDLDGAPIG